MGPVRPVGVILLASFLMKSLLSHHPGNALCDPCRVDIILVAPVYENIRQSYTGPYNSHHGPWDVCLSCAMPRPITVDVEDAWVVTLTGYKESSKPMFFQRKPRYCEKE